MPSETGCEEFQKTSDSLFFKFMEKCKKGEKVEINSLMLSDQPLQKDVGRLFAAPIGNKQK